MGDLRGKCVAALGRARVGEAEGFSGARELFPPGTVASEVSDNFGGSQGKKARKRVPEAHRMGH